MCKPLAERFTVVAFDPDPGRLAAAEAAGALTASSPAAAADGADCVVLAVRNDEHVQAALFGSGGAIETLRPGTFVILTSTIGRAEAVAVADRLAQRGVGMVDAPVSGGPLRASSGDLAVMVGADDETFDRARPVLELISNSLHRVGSAAGDGQVLKIVNQLLAGVHIAAAAEALSLAQAAGLDPGRALTTLMGGAAASFMLGDRGPRMLADDPDVLSRLDIFVKDMRLVVDLARENGVSTALAATAEQLYALAAGAGLAAEDDSSLCRFLVAARGEAEPGELADLIAKVATT